MFTQADDAERVDVLFASAHQTPLGPMLAVTCPEGLIQLEFADVGMEQALARLGPETALNSRHPHLSRLDLELAEYFAGTRREFSVPLVPRGTHFEMRAWDYLRTIPYGQTRSYGEQARAVGEPNACRAVGRANGMNRLAIVIPCHRVIGSDGKLTGYAGGLERKQCLLDHERAKCGELLF